MKITASFVMRVALGILAVCAPHTARAQDLNENCTVSVLNRNVRVNPDGFRVLPNIPANFGPVRARVTCIIDGLTISGESEPFVVPANGAVSVPRIVFGQTTPIPAILTIDASTPTLTEVGATVQLAVTAHYPGGTTKDISAAGSGTRYTISNAAIATVSAGGLDFGYRTGFGGGTIVMSVTRAGYQDRAVPMGRGESLSGVIRQDVDLDPR